MFWTLYVTKRRMKKGNEGKRVVEPFSSSRDLLLAKATSNLNFTAAEQSSPFNHCPYSLPVQDLRSLSRLYLSQNLKPLRSPNLRPEAGVAKIRRV